MPTSPPSYQETLFEAEISPRASLYPGHDAAPYYVVSPPYTQGSAGIRYLHLLVHWLNRFGQQAFLHVPTIWEDEHQRNTHIDLLTPELTQGIVDAHFAQGRTPIVLCPEVFSGSLANAPMTVRWFGNYPGALNGPSEFDDGELKYGFSSRLAKAVGQPENVLCLPLIDTATFRPPAVAAPRRGTCFYAFKYRTVDGGTPFGLPPDCVEITRGLPDSPTPQQIADRFRGAEAFYCFEESALVIEAGLCGCPAILMKDAFRAAPLGVEDFGWDGIAWGDDAAEVARAKATVGAVADNYQAVVRNVWPQLRAFIAKTQAGAAGLGYERPIRLDARDYRAELRQLREHATRLERSASWRLTAPLRWALGRTKALAAARWRP